jgi:hypothetical protein
MAAASTAAVMAKMVRGRVNFMMKSVVDVCEGGLENLKS